MKTADLTLLSDVALLAESLRRTIANDRRDLVVAMRRLAARLTENATLLETDPARAPDSLGYLTPTSLSGDVDRLAITIYAAMRTHGSLVLAIEEDANAAAPAAKR